MRSTYIFSFLCVSYVAKLGQSKEKTGFTEPEEATFFVQETGVDALAVAIVPHMDFIRKPLNWIWKDSAGTLRLPIQPWYCMVDPEIKNTFMTALKACLLETKELDLRKVFPTAIEAVIGLVKEKLEIVGGVTCQISSEKLQ